MRMEFPTGKSGKRKMNKEELLSHVLSVIFDKADQPCTHDNACSDPEHCYQSDVSDCEVCMIEIAIEETLKNGGRKESND